MSQPTGRRRRDNGRFACRVVLVLAACLFGKVQAQEIVPLPPVEEPHAEPDAPDLRKRVQELEKALAILQSETTEPSGDQVRSAGFWQNEAPTHSPIQLTSLAESVFDASKIKIGGYVKIDVIHDFNAILTTDSFDPLTIPTDGRPSENTRLHARQTRLNLDFRPVAGHDDLRLFVESDFFGVGNALRLRHAYLHAGRLLAGQTWSTFMDESIIPRTLDFESPRSVILDRRALLRWTEPLTESLAVAIALEDPQPFFDLDSAPPGHIETPAPDLIARARYERPWGHLQGAGLIRLQRYRQDSDARHDIAGWGFNFTGRANTQESNSVLFQVAFGDGCASYRNAPDTAVDASGRLEAIPVIAWLVGYEVDWTERLSSALVYSAGDGVNTSFQLADAPQATEYVAANLIFEPLPRLSYGVEYLYGTRTDKNGAKGEAHRVQFSVRYDLP